jgi:hypothetical protein
MTRTYSSLQRLETIGFRQCGSWSLVAPEKIKVTLTEHAQSANALYAFVADGEVLYVGKSTQQLRKRLYGYQNPRAMQTTNVRGNKAIATALTAKKKIDVFVLPDNGLLKFGGLHLNLAAGLEDSLISDLRPVWIKRFGKEERKDQSQGRLTQQASSFNR